MKYLLLFAVLVACSIPMQANLVNNGDFTTDCSGWSNVSTDGSFCQVGAGQTLGAGNPGGWAALNNAPSVNPSMSQAIAGLVAGTTYTLTWDMQSAYKCCGDVSTTGASVSIDGNTYLFTIQNDMTWTNFSRTFTYTGGSNVLTFTSQLNGTDQDAGFDNITLDAVRTAAPEPATLALAGGALILLGLKRKRTR